MNLQFKSDLKGGELFKKAVLFLIGFIVAMIAFVATAQNQSPLAFILLYVIVLVGAFALQYVFLSTLVNAISFNEEFFNWQGTFGHYMAINIKGLLLSCVTLFIYTPWYAKELTDYLAESIKYPGKDILFHGEAKKLLKYIFLSFIIPIIVLVIIFTAIIASAPNNQGLLVFGGFIYVVGILVFSSIYTFYVYRWYVNFTFGEDTVILEANLKESVLFLLGQLLLTIVTFGIYAFAAEVKIFEYFTNRVSFNNTSGKKRYLLFTGGTKDGFFLLLGQTILSGITFGIYMPWAYAKIQNWFISNVELQETF